jgi:hypothetical protein
VTSSRPISRGWLLLGVFIFVMGIALARPMVSPPKAQASIVPDPCNLIPAGPVRDACKVAPRPGHPLPSIPKIPGVPNAAQDVAGGFLQSLADQEAKGVQWIMVYTVDTIGSNSHPDPPRDYVDQLNLIFSLSIILSMIALALGFAKAAAAGSLKQVAWSFGFWLRFFFFGTIILVLVWKGLAFVDDKLTPAILHNVQKENIKALHSLAKVDFTKGADGVVMPFILPVLFLIPAILGGLFAVFTLVVRILVIFMLVPAIIVSLAAGPADSEWAEAQLKQNSLRMVGWISYPFWLALSLSISLGMINLGKGATGFLVPPGLAVAVMFTVSPIIAWEFTRAIGGHSWSIGRLAKGATKAIPKPSGASA